MVSILFYGCLFHAILWSGFSILSAILFRKHRNNAFYAFSISLLMMGVSFSFMTINILLSDILWIKITVVLASISIYFGLVFLSLIQDSRINVWRNAIGSMFVVSCFILIFSPRNFEFRVFEGELMYIWTGSLVYVLYLMGIITIAFTINFFIATWKKSKKILPKYTKPIFLD